MKSTRARLSVFIAASFGMLGVHLPFWPVWLEERGLDAVQIGTIAMAWAWTRGIAAPMWAHFAERGGRRKHWLVALALAALFAFVPFFALHDFKALLALTIVFSALQAPVLSLGENLIVLLAREERVSFGSVRVWGSIAFLGVSTLAGKAIDLGDADRAYDMILVLLAASAISALWVPEPHTPLVATSERFPIRAVLSERTLVAVLAGSGIVQASHATYYAFSTLHWRAAGHSNSAVGALWAEGVVAEVVLFLFATRILRRASPAQLMVLAIAGGVVRWIALGLSTDVYVLAGVQWMHALSFAAAHVATLSFIGHAVPPERSATAQSLYGAFNVAAHAITVGAITPVFAARGGVAFFPMAALSIAGGTLAALGMRAQARRT